MEIWFDDTDRGKTKLKLRGHAVVQLVEALRYMSGGRGFDS